MTVGLPRFVVAAALLVAPCTTSAQDSTAVGPDTPPAHRPGHFHIGLTIHDYGISFGNAPRVTGIRVNVLTPPTSCVAFRSAYPFKILPILNIHL